MANKDSLGILSHCGTIHKVPLLSVHRLYHFLFVIFFLEKECNSRASHIIQWARVVKEIVFIIILISLK